MKKFLIIFSLILFTIKLSYCNDSIKSKIIIFRENSFYGSANNYKIYVNDSFLVKLSNNSFYQFECVTGIYVISINNDTNTKILINAEKGKNYYIRLITNTGFWSNKPELLKTDNNISSSKIIKGNLREITNKKTTNFRTKNRIGLNIEIGGGFTEIIMFATNNGGESCISFGGGYGMGFKYGYEINKLIDIAMDLNYQYSVLVPYLDNVTTTFQRGIFSVTPSLIIPLKDGNKMRFKIGSGYSYYWNTVLKINSLEITNGFNDVWKYENASGIHACLNFEWNFCNIFMMNYGIKYYDVTYKFKSSNVKYPGNGNPLFSPKGKGLDFIIGINYLF